MTIKEEITNYMKEAVGEELMSKTVPLSYSEVLRIIKAEVDYMLEKNFKEVDDLDNHAYEFHMLLKRSTDVEDNELNDKLSKENLLNIG